MNITTTKTQENPQKLKLLFITNIISPYMHDLFSHLTKYSDKADFKVAACAYTEPDREWNLDFLDSANYKFEIIPDARLFRGPGKTRFFYLGGWSLLKEIPKYDALVFKGGTRLIGPFYVILGKLLGKKTILWEESTIESTDTFIKNLIKSLYINKNIFSSFIAYGTMVKEIIEKFNKNISNKVFLSNNCVDNDKFRNRYLKLKPKKNLIRKKLDIAPEKKVLLFAGRFVDEKNLFTLIDSVEKIVNKGEKNILCLLIGGGYLEKNLIDYTKNKKLEEYIKILPFMQFNKLSLFYALSDIFILPSKWEVWGLVVNEAMNFDLPVIVSNKVGCAPDLVFNSVNGYVFPYKDSRKLSECILKVFKNQEAMAKNSYKIIKNINFDSACKTIINSASV